MRTKVQLQAQSMNADFCTSHLLHLIKYNVHIRAELLSLIVTVPFSAQTFCIH